MSKAQQKTIPFGKLGRPHGVYGEQRLFLFNPDTPILMPGLVLLAKTDEGWRELHLESARKGSKFAIVAFEQVQTREEAEELTNSVLRVRREDFEELDEGEVYQSDLIGVPVAVQHDGGLAPIGKVKGFLDAIQDTDVMAVTGPRIKGRLLVLMRKEIVLEVDPEDGVVLASLEEWAPEDLTLEEIRIEDPA